MTTKTTSTTNSSVVDSSSLTRRRRLPRRRWQPPPTPASSSDPPLQPRLTMIMAAIVHPNTSFPIDDAAAHPRPSFSRRPRSSCRVPFACWLAIQTLFSYHSGHHGIQSNSDPFTLCSSLVYWRYSIIHRGPTCFYSLDLCHRNSDVARSCWHIADPISMGIIGFMIAILTMNSSIRYLSL